MNGSRTFRRQRWLTKRNLRLDRSLFAMTAVFAVNSEPSVGVGAAELPNIDVNKLNSSSPFIGNQSRRYRLFWRQHSENKTRDDGEGEGRVVLRFPIQRISEWSSRTKSRKGGKETDRPTA